MKSEKLIFSCILNVMRQENDDCLSCHNDRELKGTRDGKEITVYIDEKSFLLFLLLYAKLGNYSNLVFICAIFVIMGIVMNRLNVAWFGMLPSSGITYIPSWQEFTITINLISYGVVIFALSVNYLPIFEHK